MHWLAVPLACRESTARGPWRSDRTSCPPWRPRGKPDGMRLPPPSCAAAPPTLSAGASIGINSDAAILPEFVAYPQLLHTLTHSTVAVWLITINGRLSHECTNGPFEYLRAHPAWQRFVKEPQIPFHPERCFHLGAVLVQLRQDHTIFICS